MYGTDNGFTLSGEIFETTDYALRLERIQAGRGLITEQKARIGQNLMWKNNNHHHCRLTSRERNPERTAPSLSNLGSVGRLPVVKLLHLYRL